ncbi:hypothetical protein EDD27_4449 [Nonomuraea polychroma]|uniref:Uncharacterized protein n=1 Tax=Nonomuraea polychroma TaxID=46176 RepID=A0A438M834_9ACTN|nr:hypothetical protein [Nonomuraea polychroma]RVX41867.1 hypothetical protein EDD27_4449 [Nonomuraea polychroma]
MNILKRVSMLTGAAVLALTGLLTPSTPAVADSSPISVCGGGRYHVIDSHKLSKNRVVYATIYLLYNGSTNCVITWKSGSHIGNSAKLYSFIARQSDKKQKSDLGRYDIYAGPRKLKAPGECIRWGGGYYPKRGERLWWFSSWEHCG